MVTKPQLVLVRNNVMSGTIVPDIVKNLPLFAGIAEQDKLSLLEAGRLRRFQPAQYLFMHGDPVTSFHIICSGTVQLFRENQAGQEKTTDIRVAGQTLGMTEIFEASRQHQVNALAVSEVSVMEFPVNWLKENAKKYPPLALNLLAAIARYASEMEIEAEHQATMTTPQLVACFLQRVCILHDFNPCGFELPYSKALIASRLGMEAETFSRTLAKLKEQGITVEGTRVTIHDLDKIERYVCANCSVAEDCRTHQIIGEKYDSRKAH